MAIFGEKCDRCGKRTRHTEEDKPICEVCANEMALMVEAQGEAPHQCPVDGVQMVKEIAHMMVIDRCPECKGVWLDAGELERFKGGVETEALLLMARGISYPLG